MLFRSLGVAALAAASAAAFAPLSDGPSPYNSSELSTIHNLFLANINVDGSGAVVAAPSKTHPNYYFHWVRDAAISMDVLYRYGGNYAANKAQIDAYVGWVSRAQAAPDPNPNQLLEGEPKYFMDGRVYDGPWCRPQNDGAALRAIALTAVATELITTPSGLAYVKEKLYDPAGGLPIKTDLEFVAHHWMDQSCDPWEEIFAEHFFTKIVQRKAMIVGADLATALGDGGAAAYYNQQAAALLSSIDAKHWNAATGIVEETPGHYTGPPKYLNLDVAVILGALYGHVEGSSGADTYGPTSDRVLSTATHLVSSLQGVYAVNGADDARGVPGFLVGRYPNDTYDGYETGSVGNPWILATNAMGELYYSNAKEIARVAGMQLSSPQPGQDVGAVVVTALNRPFYSAVARKHSEAVYGIPNSAEKAVLDAIIPAVGSTLSATEALRLSKALASEGDGMLLRVKAHTSGAGLHFSEQINLKTGFEQGANDLTWSYGTLLSATLARASTSELIAKATEAVAAHAKARK